MSRTYSVEPQILLRGVLKEPAIVSFEVMKQMPVLLEIGDVYLGHSSVEVLELALAGSSSAMDEKIVLTGLMRNANRINVQTNRLGAEILENVYPKLIDVMVLRIVV